MKEGLASYIEGKKATKPIEAILVGTRRGDPHGGQSAPFAHLDKYRNQNIRSLRLFLLPCSQVDAVRSD